MRSELSDNADVVLRSIRAVEQRDPAAVLELFDPDIELYWPPSLPYGGVTRGVLAMIESDRITWTATWDPLQPTDAERSMDPRVVSAQDDEVVVLWHQRAINEGGECLDELVLALYEVRDGRLARGQMFYFDPVAVGTFLSNAEVGN
jgi:ketosteroid isomerase-like protein